MTNIKLFLFALTIIICQNGFAQNPKAQTEIDSLYTLVKKATSNKAKAVAMLNLCRYYEEPSTSNLDSINKYGRKVYKLSQLDKALQESRVLALSHLAYRAIMLKQKDSALYLIDTFKKLSEKLNYGTGLTYVHHRRSFYSQHIDFDTNLSIYHFQNAYKTAKAYKVPKHIIFELGAELSYLYQLIQYNTDITSAILFEIMEYVDEPGITKGMEGLYYRTIADVYQENRVFDKATLYYEKAIQLFKEINSYQLGFAMLDLAEIYHKLNDNKKAIAIFEEIIALEFSNKRINPYYGLADCYFDLKEYAISKRYYKKALEAYKARNILDFEASCLKGIGLNNLKQNNIKAANKYFNLAINKYNEVITDKKEESSYRSSVTNVYKNLSNIYEYQNKLTKSLEYHKLYAAHKDTINRSQTLKVTERFEFFEKTSEKNKEIKNLENLTKIQELKTKKDRQVKIGLFCFIAFIAILLAVILNRYRLKQKSLKIIEEKNEENKLLMQEIHHRVKNNLQIISSLLGVQIANNSNQEHIKSVLKESQNKIKSMAIIHQNLYQDNQFGKVSLNTYIRELIDQIKDSFADRNQTILFDLDIEAKEIKMSFAVPLGLILNELITNAYKYAFTDLEEKENIINISFHQLKDTTKYRLIFKDNGKGLPEDFDIDSPSSFGLQLVYGLVEQLHGEISITRQKGTCFTITFTKVEQC